MVSLPSLTFLFSWGCPLLLLIVLVISGSSNKYHRIGDFTNIYFTVLEAGKFTIKVLVDLVWAPFLVCRCPFSCYFLTWPRERSCLTFLLLRVLIPFMRALLLWAHYLLKGSPPSNITLEIRASTFEFYGNSNVQSTAVISFPQGSILQVAKQAERKRVEAGPFSPRTRRKPVFKMALAFLHLLKSPPFLEFYLSS